ncbi:MAG: M48 family metalloprotease [Pseudomonadota bacterium]
MTMYKYLILIPFLAISFLPINANAQSIIRDTEIENYMAEWFGPIFKANGMSPDQVNVIIVQSNEINAFVAGGSNIFLYTGLIEKTEYPEELIGVMAHELAHITGGHLVRGRIALEQASYESILGTIIGVGAAVAAGDAGAAAAGSTAGGSVATRRFLSKTRTFESSADQGAVRSMEQAGISPAGLLSFMRKLEGQELLPQTQQSEYIRTHPLTRNRIESLENKVAMSSKKNVPPNKIWGAQHKRMKAKLTGFINPNQVDWLYDDRDTSVSALYARAIAAYRKNDIEDGLKYINQLIEREPNNAYFYELKGQILNDFGRLSEAIPVYQKALDLDPSSGLIRMALAQAQIQQKNASDAQIKAAIENLKRAAVDEPRSSRVHRLLATAYGKIDQASFSRLHLAEEGLLQRRYNYAKTQANIALEGLKDGSTAALRARDIIFFADQNKS